MAKKLTKKRVITIIISTVVLIAAVLVVMTWTRFTPAGSALRFFWARNNYYYIYNHHNGDIATVNGDLIARYEVEYPTYRDSLMSAAFERAAKKAKLPQEQTDQNLDRIKLYIEKDKDADKVTQRIIREKVIGQKVDELGMTVSLQEAYNKMTETKAIYDETWKDKDIKQLSDKEQQTDIWFTKYFIEELGLYPDEYWETVFAEDCRVQMTEAKLKDYFISGLTEQLPSDEADAEFEKYVDGLVDNADVIMLNS